MSIIEHVFNIVLAVSYGKFKSISFYIHGNSGLPCVFQTMWPFSWADNKSTLCQTIHPPHPLPTKNHIIKLQFRHYWRSFSEICFENIPLLSKLLNRLPAIFLPCNGVCCCCCCCFLRTFNDRRLGQLTSFNMAALKWQHTLKLKTKPRRQTTHRTAFSKQHSEEAIFQKGGLESTAFKAIYS